VDGAHLVVCICGRVVLNSDGLIKHQLRFGCLGSQDRFTTQTWHRSPSQPARGHSSRPTSSSNGSSSLTPLPGRHSSSLTSLPPLSSLRSLESSRLTSLSSSTASPPASLLADMMDLSTVPLEAEPFQQSPRHRSPSPPPPRQMSPVAEGPEVSCDAWQC
jgi:hypothetical protein